MRRKLRLQQMALTTERSYIQWYRRFVFFHGGNRHPRELGVPEIEAFLTHLAVEGRVAAATQNQALNAVIFLYREVLDIPLEGINAVRAKEQRKIPVVLTQAEVKALLCPLPGGDAGLAVKLLYGCGLRLMECLRLRVKDVDRAAGVVRVHDGKGGKDRVVTFPERLREEMEGQLARIRPLHEADREADLDGVYMPKALDLKAPVWGKRWEWFWVFPSTSLSIDPRSGKKRRHHLKDVTIGRAIQKAVVAAGIEKKVTAHTMRHCYATMRFGFGWTLGNRSPGSCLIVAMAVCQTWLTPRYFPPIMCSFPICTWIISEGSTLSFEPRLAETRSLTCSGGRPRPRGSCIIVFEDSGGTCTVASLAHG